MSTTIERIDSLLTPNPGTSALLEQRTFDEDRLLRLVTTLHEVIGNRAFFEIFRIDLLTAIRGNQIDLVVKVLESFALPYAHEFSHYWASANESYRALFRLITIRSNQYSTKGYEMLDRDPELMKDFSNELRVLCAVHSEAVSIESRAKVICRSESAVLMTYNTPLYLLFKERPEQIDLIVDLIRMHGETDGGRIAEMLDSGHGSLVSGYL